VSDRWIAGRQWRDEPDRGPISSGAHAAGSAHRDASESASRHREPSQRTPSLRIDSSRILLRKQWPEPPKKKGEKKGGKSLVSSPRCHSFPLSGRGISSRDQEAQSAVSSAPSAWMKQIKKTTGKRNEWMKQEDFYTHQKHLSL